MCKIARAIQPHAMPRASPFETLELVHLARCDIEPNRTGISQARIIANNLYKRRLHFAQRCFEKNEALFAIKVFSDLFYICILMCCVICNLQYKYIPGYLTIFLCGTDRGYCW